MKAPNQNVLLDNAHLTLSPIFQIHPIFAYPIGIQSPLEKLDIAANENIIIKQNITNNRDEEFYRNYFKTYYPYFNKLNITIDDNKITQDNSIDDIFNSFKGALISDIEHMDKSEFIKPTKPNLPFEGSFPLLIHKRAQVSKMSFLDVSEGPIIISAGVKVSPFCILKGPLYISDDTIIDKAMISNSRIGRGCRIGGEISDSFFGNYSNKHHEGFVGHSIVGNWVNLGALTTTSDLKNNYGKIKLEYKSKTYTTERIKLGSIIGDFVKTGIGSMLNTGTIIDFGSLLFHGFTQRKYFSTFYWGGSNENRYELERFLADIKIIMARRKQIPDSNMIETIKSLYASI